MYKVGNKIVKVGNIIPISEDRTVIELTVRGTCFLDRTSSGTNFTLASSVVQKMYIDFADNTGIHTFNLKVGNNSWLNPDVFLWYYQDLADPSKIGTVDPNYPQERKIKMWFDYPSAITRFNLTNANLYGEFPKNIGNYRLSDFRLSGVNYLESFPTKFRGGDFILLTLNNISPNRITSFPTWLSQSRIQTLNLTRVFNFTADYNLTNINLVSNIQNLRSLAISANMMRNNSFPTTLKDIPTLETLYTGGNPFTIFPSAIGDCAQLKTLVLSDSDGYDYNTTMTSWGDGIGKMVSLSTLTYAVSASANFPTTVPTGVGTCILLKNIKVKQSFATSQARTDAFVNNWYDFVVANASLVSGNTKFRQMVFDMGNTIGAGSILRPSGGATPSSIVDPPTTPIEKIYYLCKKYAHTWTIRNLANTAIEIIAP